MIKTFEEFNRTNITAELNGDYVIFKLNETEIGEMVVNIGYFDDIQNEYSDSIEDFDASIMRKFDYNKPIVNIEDIWVYKNFRGQNLFREMLAKGIDLLTRKYSQFILRASSDNDFPEDKLVEIYKDAGFIPYQETEEDGTIMFQIYKK